MKYRRYLRLRGRTRSERVRELQDEIEAHIAMRADDLERRGVPRSRALAEARARFGDATAVLASARARDERLRLWEMADELVRDVRIAWRRALNTPGATLLTVLTFALGIGLTTTTLAFADHILLRPLPYADPARLYQLQGRDSVGNPIAQVSVANWADWTEGSRTIEATALYMGRELAIVTGGDAIHVQGQLVTTGFFDALGTRMLTGRGFAVGDAAAGVVVVSEGLADRELAGSAVGAKLRIEGSPYVVAGVVPAGLEYPAGTEVWLPLDPPRATGSFRNHINWEAVARLREDVSPADAAAELDAAARRVQEADPVSDYSYGVRLLPLRNAVVGDYASHLKMVLAAVALVLLLACVNLAALNLARSSARREELGLRFALGASRARVVRQLMTEQAALALAGACVGVLFAGWATRLLSLELAGRLPRAEEVVLDGRVLVLAILATACAAIGAGLAPALLASRAAPGRLLGTRGARSGGTGVPGTLLVAAEVALALVLLTTGTLLARSFTAVVARDLGFEPRAVATGPVTLRGPAYPDGAARLRAWQALLTRIQREPGTRAALANWVPGRFGGTSYLVIEGTGPVPDGAGYRVVSDDYFDVLDIPLLRGRTFDERDRAGSTRVALVNRQLVRRHFGERDPIGRRIKLPGMEGPEEEAPWVTIVGVVGDVRHYGYEDDLAPEAFVSHRQVLSWNTLTLVVHTVEDDGSRSVDAIRRAVHDLDPSLPVRITLLEDDLGELLVARRVTMAALTAFGLLALALAVLGVYGLIAFAVVRRIPELAIRAALGASRVGIVRIVLRNAATVMLGGAAAGLLMAFWLAQLLQNVLIDVRPGDPVSFVAAAAVLLAAGMLAALVPAARAARVDPLTALRRDG